jgi:hypothetical protein
MKKGLRITLITFAIIGALLIALLVFVSLTAGPKLVQGKIDIKNLSTEIIDSTIKTQNYSNFSNYSNEGLQQALKEENTQKVFKIYTDKLGRLVSYGEVEFKSINTMSGGAGNAQVVTSAVFEKGKAEITFEFIRDASTGKWLLNSFNINSPALM